jgi:hypothetical protein
MAQHKKVKFLDSGKPDKAKLDAAKKEIAELVKELSKISDGKAVNEDVIALVRILRKMVSGELGAQKAAGTVTFPIKPVGFEKNEPQQYLTLEGLDTDENLDLGENNITNYTPLKSSSEDLNFHIPIRAGSGKKKPK